MTGVWREAVSACHEKRKDHELYQRALSRDVGHGIQDCSHRLLNPRFVCRLRDIEETQSAENTGMTECLGNRNPKRVIIGIDAPRAIPEVEPVYRMLEHVHILFHAEFATSMRFCLLQQVPNNED